MAQEFGVFRRPDIFRPPFSVAFVPPGVPRVRSICSAASSVYLVNDVFDRRLDQLSPRKRTRPIASGVVPVSWALAASVILALAALVLACRLSYLCTGLMLLYLTMNAADSARIKHAVLLDVGLIAFGFVLRVLYGCYAVEVKPTSWIALCMFFLATFLGFAKRGGRCV
jgi:4-hydroxybenzoate polyprenyltransferase